MQFVRAIVSVGVVVVVAGASPVDEFRDLFDGKSLDGWVVDGPKADKAGKPIWAVRDGMIVASGKAFGFLRYDRANFSDFALRVEYRFSAADKGRGNSGLGIRTGVFDPKKSQLTRPSFAGYEIQLLDDAGKPPAPTAAGRSTATPAPRRIPSSRPRNGTRPRSNASARGSW